MDCATFTTESGPFTWSVMRRCLTASSCILDRARVVKQPPAFAFDDGPLTPLIRSAGDDRSDDGGDGLNSGSSASRRDRQTSFEGHERRIKGQSIGETDKS